MDLPPFVSYPPEILRREIPPQEWMLCIDAWVYLAQRTLSLPSKSLSIKFAKDSSLSKFLISYAQEVSAGDGSGFDGGGSKDLGRVCFLLIHRLTTDVDPPPSLLEWSFLGDFCTVYAKTSNVQSLITTLWQRFSLDQKSAMQESKHHLGQLLDADLKDSLSIEQSLRRTIALLKASYDYGRFLMTGSDLLDSLIVGWSSADGNLRIKITAITYLALLSLLLGERPNVSLLLDHVYSLKTDTEKHQAHNSTSSLLSQIASTTPFVQKLQDLITGPDASRAKSLISYLKRITTVNSTRPKRRIRRRIDKGKGREEDEYGHSAIDHVHVHKMSLITQIQDLFPDLGSGFITKLLDEYDGNAEEVTAHLLEDSLPLHLRDVDRTADIAVSSHHDNKALPLSHTPRPTPPLLSTRKNIFDNDDLDRLTVDTSKLHFGRKNPTLTADDLLADRSSAPTKAAILSALAAFDSDDDERDDTYDAQDVGGTVDSSAILGDHDADLRDNNEEPLFRAYTLTPATFDRDSATRRGKARQALKTETGMTDEAIEGWAIMIGRDPRRLRRLEAKFSITVSFTGGQSELAATAYREGAGATTESGTEDPEGGSGGAGRGRGRGGSFPRGSGRGRGTRGRGRGGGGGNVAGPADDKTTQVARQRKDASKGSRANHNRRDQRARKMARGGLPG